MGLESTRYGVLFRGSWGQLLSPDEAPNSLEFRFDHRKYTQPPTSEIDAVELWQTLAPERPPSPETEIDDSDVAKILETDLRPRIHRSGKVWEAGLFSFQRPREPTANPAKLLTDRAISASILTPPRADLVFDQSLALPSEYTYSQSDDVKWPHRRHHILASTISATPASKRHRS